MLKGAVYYCTGLDSLGPKMGSSDSGVGVKSGVDSFFFDQLDTPYG